MYDKEQRLVKLTNTRYFWESESKYEIEYEYGIEYEYDAQGRPGKLVESKVSENGSWRRSITYVYDEYGFLIKMVSNEGETIDEYQYIGDTIFVFDSRWYPSVFKCVYSNDLYMVYSCVEENSVKTEEWYEWENGNCMSIKRGTSIYEYNYDDKYNRHWGRKVYLNWYPEQVLALSKNNYMELNYPRWSYSYTDRGMVAKAEAKTEKWVYTYTYLYY